MITMLVRRRRLTRGPEQRSSHWQVATKAAVERCARERQRGDFDIAQGRPFGTQALELGGCKLRSRSIDF